MVWRTFGWSFVVTAGVLGAAFAYGGLPTLAVLVTLSILEVSLSFDNAVVNATVLQRMSPLWQRLFLTVGILIAVFGMRLLFPLLVVAVTAGLSPGEVVTKALAGGGVDQPGSYAHLLHAAHPAIAAFGGMFLLMLFLDFILEDRDLAWLQWVERPLARLGRLDQLPTVVALVSLVAAAHVFAVPLPCEATVTADACRATNLTRVLVPGIAGVVTYLLVNGLGEVFEEAAEDRGTHVAATGVAGRAGLMLFLYLEVLDASFSFDGVIGAFAITQDIVVIAGGLGVGAMYIRSLTVYLVRAGTLGRYVFLEHGAHWAIGALAVILLVSIAHEVPDLVTGLVGVGFIGAAFASSVARNRRD